MTSIESSASHLRDECSVLTNAADALRRALRALATSKELNHKRLTAFRSRIRNLSVYAEFVLMFSHLLSGKYSVPNQEREAKTGEALAKHLGKMEDEDEPGMRWRLRAVSTVQSLMAHGGSSFSAGSLSKLGWSQLAAAASPQDLQLAATALAFHRTQTLPCATDLLTGVLGMVDDLFSTMMNEEPDDASSFQIAKGTTFPLNSMTVHGVIGQWLADHTGTDLNRIMLWSYHTSDWRTLHMLSSKWGLYMEPAHVGSLDFVLSEIRRGKGNHVVDLMRAIGMKDRLKDPYTFLSLLRVAAENDSHTVFYTVLEWYVDSVPDGELPTFLATHAPSRRPSSSSSSTERKESDDSGSSSDEEEEDEEEEEEEEENDKSEDSDEDYAVLPLGRDAVRETEDEVSECLETVWTFLLSADMIGCALPLLQQFDLDDADVEHTQAFWKRIPGFAARRLAEIGSMRAQLAALADETSLSGFHSALEKYLHATQNAEAFGPATVHGAPRPSLMVPQGAQKRHGLTVHAVWKFVEGHPDCLALLKTHGFPASQVPDFVLPAFQKTDIDSRSTGEYFQYVCVFDSGARPSQRQTKVQGMPSQKRGPRGGKPMSRKFGIVMDEFRNGKLKAGRGKRPNLDPKDPHDRRVAMAIAYSVERKQEALARKRRERKK